MFVLYPDFRLWTKRGGRRRRGCSPVKSFEYSLCSKRLNLSKTKQHFGLERIDEISSTRCLYDRDLEVSSIVRVSFLNMYTTWKAELANPSLWRSRRFFFCILAFIPRGRNHSYLYLPPLIIPNHDFIYSKALRLYMASTWLPQWPWFLSSLAPTLSPVSPYFHFINPLDHSPVVISSP